MRVRRVSCSEFLYWFFKGVPLTRAAARRRSVTAVAYAGPVAGSGRDGMGSVAGAGGG
jgi:hypothetical protein